MTVRIHFTLNGRPRDLEADPQVTLVELLREELFLTGTKEGCGVGECGACVVLIDDEPVVSCLMLAVDANRRRIETVEGLAADGRLTEVQEAFVDAGAFQCGFCTPAMVLSVEALLRVNPAPEVTQVTEALAGILCRCGAYPKILDAVAAINGVQS